MDMAPRLALENPEFVEVVILNRALSDARTILYFLGSASQGQMIPVELTRLQRRAPSNDAFTEAFLGNALSTPPQGWRDEG
jgi:hypothetical protein